MVINVVLKNNGVEIKDYLNITIRKSQSKNNSAGKFEINFPSPFGKAKGQFTVGDEVTVFADQNAAATTLLFTGLVEKIRFIGKETEQNMNISGRDFSARLMDVTVEPIVYDDSEVSTIVKNLIDLECQDVTYTNVDTTNTTVEKISFKHESVFEAIKKLAKVAGYQFWVDENKDVNFKEIDTIPSGVSLNRDNIIKSRYENTREGMANMVWIYGDRIFTGANDLTQADGGSQFDTTFQPHQTQVFVNDQLISPGGVAGIEDLILNNAKYLVDFQAQNVVFTSGTTAGNNIPTSGDWVSIDYNRKVPIVKYGQNQNSIDAYGPKETVINDTSITSNQVAQELLEQVLNESDPFHGITLELKGWFTFGLGESIAVDLTDFNLSETVDLIGIDYVFDTKKCETEQVVKVKVNKKIMDITDAIKDIEERLGILESPQSVELLTRYYQTEATINVIGSSWKISTRQIGSGLTLGHPVNGKLGAPYMSAVGQQIVLGAPIQNWIIQSQGGYY